MVTGTTGNPTLLNPAIVSPAPQVAMAASMPLVTTPISNEVPKQSKGADVKNGLSQQNKPVGDKVAQAKIATNAGVELAVREYFADIPLMIEIAKAESKFRQFGTDGLALRGVAVKEDTGVFQINKTYHLARSQRLGYDIDTLAGNMAYARRLYEESGPQPWASSYSMWGKSPLAANFKPRNRAPIVVATTEKITTQSAIVKPEITASAGTPVSAVTTTASAPAAVAVPADVLVAGEEIVSPALHEAKEIPQVIKTTQTVLSE